jgi:hypothetical protein
MYGRYSFNSKAFNHLSYMADVMSFIGTSQRPKNYSSFQALGVKPIPASFMTPFLPVLSCFLCRIL